MTIRRRFWALFIAALLVVFSLPLFSIPSAAPPARPLRLLTSQPPAGAQAQVVTLNSPLVIFVQITDPYGTLVDNAALQSAANMPLMDMGSLHVTALRIHHGLYRLSLTFTMPGSWRVQLDARAPAYLHASQQLNFWVQAVPPSDFVPGLPEGKRP
jgi:hypothetical protein